MRRFSVLLLLFILAGSGPAAQALASLPTAGAVVVIPAIGEVTHANDQAIAMFMIEEQDKDKSSAASRVNQKMKQGMEIIKREDPQAILKTRGYYTIPVYAEEQAARQNNKVKQAASWRVGQYLEVTTTSLNGLPKTVAAAQRLLALNSLQFGLAEATSKKLDEQRIAAAYQNLVMRITAIAKAMGRNVSDAVLETVDFEGSGVYLQQDAPNAKMTMRSAAAMEQTPVEEPSFEPGQTTLHMQVIGKVKFK